MKSIVHQLRWIGLIAVLAMACSIAGAATIHKTDDTVVTGDLKSVADGKLTVIANKSPVVIGLDDIAQVTIKEPVAAVVAKTAAPVADNSSQDDGPNLGSALFGALFSSNGQSHPALTPSPTVTAVAATAPATTQPTAQITLTDGDQLHAKVLQWADQKLQMQLSVGPTLNLPSSSVSQLWLGTQDLQAKAKSLTVEPGPEDVAFVVKKNDVVIVKGLAQGIAGDALQFRYGDQDRKIALNKIVGLLLRSNPLVPMPGFHQRVHADTGDQFSGILSGIDHDSIMLNVADTPIKILLSTITTIDFVNGRVTSLCDLKPSKVEQAAYFGRLMGYRIDKSLTGGPLVLSDGTVSRGIAVHSRCVLQYDLPEGIDRFKTTLGFSQADGQLGRVLARVIGDQKVLYENPDARGDQPPIEIDVPMTRVHTLTLVIDFGKDQDVGDRVIWANPRLLRDK